MDPQVTKCVSEVRSRIGVVLRGIVSDRLIGYLRKFGFFFSLSGKFAGWRGLGLQADDSICRYLVWSGGWLRHPFVGQGCLDVVSLFPGTMFFGNFVFYVRNRSKIRDNWTRK